ncbi:MAG TPA: neutral zinc metallopeptidase [Ohtaekwangia sp.]|nr:neutral zinc metallopeptidase [Ohtaekwangia sp.]
MRWIGRQRSGNVQDRRGVGGSLAVGGGIGGVIILVLALLMGQNPLDYLNTENPKVYQESNSTADDEKFEFVSVVLKDTEDVWHKLFTERDMQYQEPQLVVFSGSDQSGCGHATAATGPFYCPNDSKVYIDLSFYDQLQSRFGAPGDFAMAYVIAHEVGHHVQHLLGISDKVHQAQRGMSQEEANDLSVKLELQADFFAGVWAHHADEMKQILEAGDIEEALGAANAIGDDRLQMQSQGYVVPDAFTHGTSAQRMGWFKKGFETGDLNAGNTFEEIQ